LQYFRSNTASSSNTLFRGLPFMDAEKGGFIPASSECLSGPIADQEARAHGGKLVKAGDAGSSPAMTAERKFANFSWPLRPAEASGFRDDGGSDPLALLPNSASEEGARAPNQVALLRLERLLQRLRFKADGQGWF
jgi:hypothetical protein